MTRQGQISLDLFILLPLYGRRTGPVWELSVVSVLAALHTG